MWLHRIRGVDARAEHGDIILGSFRGNPRAQPRDHGKLVIPCLPRIEHEWPQRPDGHPQISVTGESVKSCRQNTDDRVRRALDVERMAEYGRIGVQASIPEVLADEYRQLRLWTILVGKKVTA